MSARVHESPIVDFRGLKPSSKVRDTLADFLLSAYKVLEGPRKSANNPVADFRGLVKIWLNGNPTKSD